MCEGEPEYQREEIEWKRGKFWPLRLMFNNLVYGDMNKKLVDAARKGRSPEVSDWLIRGADIHAWNDLALREAALNDHRNTVALLLDTGAYPDLLPKGSLRPSEYIKYLYLRFN